MLSEKVKGRYPTYQHLVESGMTLIYPEHVIQKFSSTYLFSSMKLRAGWMLPHEKAILDGANEHDSQSKWYAPLLWAERLIHR
jgi:hypothetical protein